MFFKLHMPAVMNGSTWTWPNHALQRTRPSRSGCNPRVPRAGSLSLGLGSTSEKRMQQPEPLTLEIESPEGEGVLQAATNDPLVAAFRRGFEEGQITGLWRFFAVTQRPAPPKVIGNFVRTPNGRILFFPAAGIQMFTVDPTAHFNGKLLDHITLDQ